MRCKQCHYPLWNTTTRVCPECGLPFAPSQYTFVPNSVRFCCPTCKQAYYGTSDRGLLVPDTFTCVTCRAHLHQDAMLLLPAVGVNESQTLGGTIPWRERATVGVVSAFFGTIALAAFAPANLARFAGQECRPLEAVTFGLINVALSALLLMGTCVGTGVLFDAFRLGVQANSQTTLQMGLSAATSIGLPILIVAAVALVWVPLTHFALTLGVKRSLPIGKTIECFGYAYGASFLAGIPCLGYFLSPLAQVWVIVSAAVQLSCRHEVSGVRATLATLTIIPITAIPLVLLAIFT